MRKSSIYPTRSSHAGSLSSQASSAQLTAKLLQTKKENEVLRALDRMSAEYVRRLDAIDFDCNVMADTGRIHGEVLSQWPEMFRILSLSYPQAAPQGGAQGAAPESCERLVRIPLDELQQRENAKL